MAYLSDTMRVEMALPANIMLAVLLSGANAADPGPAPTWDRRQSMAEHQRVHQKWKDSVEAHAKKRKDPVFEKAYSEFLITQQLLTVACFEPLQGLYPDRKVRSLMKRIERVHAEIIKPYINGNDPDPRKIGLIAYYLINSLVETEYLIIPEYSSFGRALDVMLPALSPWEGSTQQEIADYGRLNASAHKQFRHVLHQLQNSGYYLGLNPPSLT
jgi:hypothetical protein